MKGFVSEWVRIRISDYYRNPVGEKEYIFVSREVYDVLKDTFRKEAHAQEMKDHRHLTKNGYIEGCTEELAFEQEMSLEDIVILRMDIEILKKSMQSLSVLHRERLYLYFCCNLTFRQIGEKIGISDMAVRWSIEVALEKIKKQFV